MRAAGASKDRLGAKDIRRAGRGIVLHPDYHQDQDAYAAKCLAVAAALPSQRFVSRRSAAILHGIPCPQPPGGRVEVGSIWPLRAPRRGDVLGHRVRDGVLEWVDVRGFRLPSVEDVWCQLSAVLSPVALVAAGDALITGKLIVSSGGRRRAPQTTGDALAAAVRRHRGAVGATRRSEALELLRSPVDSPPETELRMLIRSSGFAEPEVACAVQVAGRVLHPDLGYPELRIAIEYLGSYHFDDRVRQGRHDVRRGELLKDAGWNVLWVTAYDLRAPGEFLRRLARAIAAATRAA